MVIICRILRPDGGNSMAVSSAMIWDKAHNQLIKFQWVKRFIIRPQSQKSTYMVLAQVSKDEFVVIQDEFVDHHAAESFVQGVYNAVCG